MRGNISYLATFSKFLKRSSDLYEPHKINGFGNANLSRFRLFSSFDGQNRNGQFKKGGRDDFNGGRNEYGYDNDGRKNYQPSVRDLVNDPSKGEQQGGKEGGDGDFLEIFKLGDSGKEEENQSKEGISTPQVGGDKIEEPENADEHDGRKNYQPSLRDLFNGPLKGEQQGGKESGDGDFLEIFKLGDSGKEEENQSKEGISTPQAKGDKIEEPENDDEIFNKMKKFGLIPNAVAMLDGLCQDGLVHEAMKLFGLMREKGTLPEVVVYTAAVEGFCRAHKLDDAKRIFKKMQSNGIVPNAFSYTVLIKGLCKGKKLDDATDFCVEMLEAGHVPNVPTFTGLVHEFCKEKGVEEAQKVIGALKQKGLVLDEKAVRVYLDKSGPSSPLVWEAIFGPKKTERAF